MSFTAVFSFVSDLAPAMALFLLRRELRQQRNFMDNVQNPQGDNPTLDSEELKQEEEALKDAQQEEVRAQVIEKYGLDEEADAELIENLATDAIEQRKAMGKAIRQKREWREKATKSPEPKTPEVKPTPQPPQQQADVSAIVREQLEQRDLESMDLPDDIKAEVQRLAKLQGISVRKAASDPYIKYKIDEYNREQTTTDAAVTRTRKGTKVKFDPQTPPEVDMSTEEGRKTWDEWVQSSKENAG
jgi:hypothetical protein